MIKFNEDLFQEVSNKMLDDFTKKIIKKKEILFVPKVFAKKVLKEYLKKINKEKI